MQSLYLSLLQQKTPLELIEDAIRLSEEDAVNLSTKINAGAIHAYFQEWRICLQRFALQFSPDRQETRPTAQALRLIRTCDLGVPLIELESVQLADQRFHIDKKDHTLNVQLGFSNAQHRPYYQIHLGDIHGIIIDRHFDFRAPTNKKTPSLSSQTGELLMRIEALGSLPPDLNAAKLKAYIKKLDTYRDAYHKLLRSKGTPEAIALREIELHFKHTSQTKTFTCFASGSIPLKDIFFEAGDWLCIRQINGGDCLFKLSTLAHYTVYKRKLDLEAVPNDYANFLEGREEILSKTYP